MWKDVVIGLLVAYIVVDIMMAYALKKRYPSLMEKTLSSLNNQGTVVAIIIGLLLGLMAWYFSKRTISSFKIGTRISQEVEIKDEKE